MPATVTGAFVIIDRASRPMKAMERQANQTDRAIDRLGRRLDKVFDLRRQRQIETSERALRNFGRQARQTDSEVNRLDTSTGRFTRTTRRTTREVGFLERAMRKLVIITSGLGRLFKPTMLAGIIVLVGAAAQAIGALAAAVVALIPQLVGAIGAVGTLIPQLAQLGGVAAALPGIFIGVGTAVITAKLAFKDFGEAMSGNEKALERLSPAARSFLQTLKQYSPVIDQLRASAQGGLFGGLDFAVRRIQRGVPVVNALIANMSSRLGQLARQAATRFTGGGFLNDLLGIGQTGGRAVSRGGRAIINLVDALRHVAVAARPFTEWITRTVELWSKFIFGAARAGRETGRIERYLSRTRAALTQFGHILRDVWFTLMNIGKAMRPTGETLWGGIERAAAAWRRFTGSVEGQARMQLWFKRAGEALGRMWRITVNLGKTMVGLGRASRTLGDSLWGSFDRAAKRWADFSNSLGGQIKLTRWFNSTGKAIYEIVGLFTDLTMAIAQMGADQSLAGFVHQLREIVPIIQRILTTITEAFGPPFVRALVAAGELLESLAGAAGPLTIFLEMLAGILNLINKLIQIIPGLSTVLTAALTVVGINFFITRVRALAVSWMGVAEAATIAGGAQAMATGGVLAGAGGRGSGRRLAGAEMASAYALGGWRGAARGTPGIGGKLVGGAARGLGKLALPLMAIMGLFDAATAKREGNVGYQSLQTLSSAVSGASFGLIPRVQTGSAQAAGRERNMLRTRQVGTGPTGWGGFLQGYTLGGRERPEGRQVLGLPQQLGTRLSEFGGENPRNRSDVVAQIKIYEQHLRRIRGMQASPEMQAYRATLQTELEIRRGINRQMAEQERAEARIKRQRAAEKDVNTARRLLPQYGRRFNATAARVGVGGAMSETNTLLLRDMEALRPAGRRILAQNTLAWAREAARQNPQLRDEYQTMFDSIIKKFKDLGQTVKIVNGRILTGSKSEWRSIADTLGSHAERGLSRVTAAFAAIRRQAVGSLTAMGFTPSQAANLVAATEAGGLQAKAAASATRSGTYASPVQGLPSYGGGRGDMGSSGGPVTGGRRDVSPGLWDELGMASALGLKTISTSRPGATVRGSGRQSLHSFYPSRAVDVASGSNLGQGDPRMAALFRALVGRPGLSEVILSPMIWSPTNGLRRATGTALADHWNHVHFGARGGGGAPGEMGGLGALAGMFGINAPQIGLPGWPGAVGQPAVDMFAAGMQKKLPEVAFGGWFGKGGTITARRPTIIGMGEGGTETATITRGGGRGGGNTLTIENAHFHGDRDEMLKTLREAWALFADELDRQPMVGDSELLN